jgi:ADP-ribose pyrophosphatase
MIKPWPLREEQTILETRIFDLVRRRSESPRTGREHDFYLLKAPDWVNVIPILEDERVLLIRQYRHGCSEATLEIPGGMMDTEDRSPEETASRELLEETGYHADALKSIGSIAPNPAILSNRCHSYLATRLSPKTEQRLDGTEDIEVVAYPLLDIPGLIQNGQISHALVVVAFTFFFGLVHVR